MEGAAYRLTPRGFPGAPVDSVLMRVAVGPDHAGSDRKEILTTELAARGERVRLAPAHHTAVEGTL
jgi:hypothetical protein